MLHTDRLIRLLSFLLSSFSQPSYYLGHFKGISRLGGIVPLLNINQLALHHVFEAIFVFQNAFFLTLMGDWAVVMPNKAGEKKTAPSQTLTVFLPPSINISTDLRTAELMLAAEDGYSTAYSTGRWFKCYKQFQTYKWYCIWTMDKKLIIFTILRLLEISPENMQHQGDFKSLYQSSPVQTHFCTSGRCALQV